MKKILAIVLALIVAMALTVTVFAGASSGYYTGTLNVGLASLPCTLNIGSSVATATITQDSTYNDFTIGVTINGTYKSSTSGSVLTTSNGNNGTGNSVSTSISYGGGTWWDVYASYSAYRSDSYNGSISLP